MCLVCVCVVCGGVFVCVVLFRVVSICSCVVCVLRVVARCVRVSVCLALCVCLCLCVVCWFVFVCFVCVCLPDCCIA